MIKLKNILVAAFTIVAVSNTTSAQVIPTSYSVSAAAPFQVQYTGSNGGYLFFKVTLNYNEATNAKLSIDDNKAGEIYSSGFRSNLKVSTVKIERADADQVLNFKLSFGNKTFLKTFSINTNLIETTTVAEDNATR